jgi:hypothetical protein
MKAKNNNSVQDQDDNSSKPLLCDAFIDALPNTDEKIIDKYLRTISKEIAQDAKILGIGNARQNANIKYGKFWRSRLTIKKIYNSPNPFGKMSYY